MFFKTKKKQINHQEDSHQNGGDLQQSPAYPNLKEGIHLQGVSVMRDQRLVLDNIDLTFNCRKLGLIGNNGSGKSTLARLLNGLIAADSGLVSVYGYDAAQQSRVLPSLVGFIFQNPDHQIIFPTVLEELSFGLEQLGHSPAESKQQALGILQQHQLQHWQDLPIQHLSEGQKQRVCILAILAMRPRLIILDEPFSSLDLPTRQQMLQMIDELQTSVLMISHDMETFADFDRLLCLHEGKIIDDGTPQQVIAAYRQRHLNA